MKKLAFLLLIITILLSSVTAFATDDKSIENAITAIQQKIVIPENYTDFSSDITINQNSKIIRLMWSGESTSSQTGGQINVGVDEKNRIIEYYGYEYGNYSGDYKLSKIDYNAAVAIANDEIKKMCPEFAHNIKAKQENNYILRNNDSYDIVFYRYENNIPCYDNYILASVNAHDKKLARLEVKWYDVAKISPNYNIISLETAKQKFYDNIGVELSYKSSRGSNDTFLQYSTNINGNEYINAYTGDILSTNSMSDTRSTKYYEKIPYMDSNLIYQFSDAPVYDENIEMYLRSIAELQITENYTPFETSFFKDEDGNEYAKMVFSKDQGNQTIAVTINSATKEITNYNKYPIKADYNKMLSKEDCKKIATDFSEKYAAEKYKQCKESKGLICYNFYDENSTFCFYFLRQANGLSYNNNNIYIEVSSATGDVVGFQSTWGNNAKFTSAEGVISPEIAYAKMIENVGFELQYVPVMPQGSKNYELKLVYNFKTGYPIFIDAKTGNWTYNTGEPFIPEHSLTYSDIEGNKSQKQIEALLSCGVLPYSEKFYPDKLITQKEFLQYAIKSTGKNFSKDATPLYETLIKQNVITANERDENAPVTNEQGIKYLMRILGYTDIAELDDTYQTDFVDEAMIDPSLLGYAAIAKGFNIIKGNAFTPKTELTRAIAAEIFYNMMTN